MSPLETRILEILHHGRPEVAFDEANHLVDDGLLDSFEIVMLTTELEKEFGISVPGDEILPDNFASLASIATLVARLQAVR